MEDDDCHCQQHGKQPATNVCSHITDAPTGSTVGFVSGPSDHEDDLRDAWCESCDDYLQSNGGEWSDDVGVPDGISILCAECYRARRDDAERAGRRIIRDV